MGATYWPIANNRCQPGLLQHQDYDSRKTLSPGRLDRILDQECGARPTVVVVSACHAGVFIGRASKGDNRIWLTAARDDRVSFGCGALDAWPKSDGACCGGISECVSSLLIPRRPNLVGYDIKDHDNQG